MGFTCDYCGKVFGRHWNLNFHLRTHGINNVPSNFTGGRKTPLTNVLDQTTISNEEVHNDDTLLKQELINIGKNALERLTTRLHGLLPMMLFL